MSTSNEQLHDAWRIKNDTLPRILELDAFGFSQFWRARFSKVAKECVEPKEPLRIRRLSLSHLSATFVVLAIGFGLGIVTFLGETVAFISRKTS